ncbi:hypothetical protein [Streptomyces sp. NPDC090135]|uniref:hypothetical protein n=1 Tax=Streptomyces sp. NPDC090135 TaxID=3365957 RepID=UPI003826D629
MADPDGRKILTRVGNGELGWNHFSGKHNIKKHALVDILLQGNVDRVSGADTQYWRWATNRAYGRVKLIVKVRYAQDCGWALRRGPRPGGRCDHRVLQWHAEVPTPGE